MAPHPQAPHLRLRLRLRLRMAVEERLQHLGAEARAGGLGHGAAGTSVGQLRTKSRGSGHASVTAKADAISGNATP